MSGGLVVLLVVNGVLALAGTVFAVVAVVRPAVLSHSARPTSGERFYSRLYAARGIPIGVLAAAAPGATLLVVAHNTLLRVGLCALIGLPVARYRHVFPRLDNAAVTEVALHPDADRPAALLSLNVPCPPLEDAPG